ncbi:MAG: methyltransferase domain-containing protein [Granulicella sp.]
MIIDQESAAYVPGAAYYDDNITLLRASLEQILRRTATLPSISLLSLGVGHRHVVKGLIEGLDGRLASYVIVEGSQEIIDLFNREVAPPPQVRLVHAYFEDFDTDQRFDVIEMGFILEHVTDPGLILERYKCFLEPGGRIMIAVPNAHSLHRLIGHSAGLLDDLHHLSEADIALGHRRYFNPVQIRSLVIESGLQVTDSAGLMLKPLTSAQLASLALGDQLITAMNEVAFGLPEVSNAIFIEARLCD